MLWFWGDRVLRDTVWCSKFLLFLETSGAAIYYTLNGAKPTPFQQFGPDAKATLAYRAPFTLPFGKHTVKAVAVSEYVIHYNVGLSNEY